MRIPKETCAGCFAAKVGGVIDSVSTGSGSDRIRVRPQSKNKVFCYSNKLLDPAATAPGSDTLDFCSKARCWHRGGSARHQASSFF